MAIFYLSFWSRGIVSVFYFFYWGDTFSSDNASKPKSDGHLNCQTKILLWLYCLFLFVIILWVDNWPKKGQKKEQQQRICQKILFKQLARKENNSFMICLWKCSELFWKHCGLFNIEWDPTGFFLCSSFSEARCNKLFYLIFCLFSCAVFDEFICKK